MNRPIKSRLLHTLAAAIFAVVPAHQAHAAPGTLPSSPLILSTLVEPNIFLTLDDSGSMAWAPIIEPTVGGLNMYSSFPDLPMINGSARRYYHPAWYSDDQVVPPADLYPDAWVLRSSLVNKLYYNPSVTYVPWAGVDAAGNPLYTDADPTNAPQNPNNPGGVTTNLTINHTYDDGDVSGPIYLPTYYRWIDDGDGLVHASLDKGAPVTITDAAGLRNFANWFVYYRTREFTAKAGIGRVITNVESVRMGLSVFNAGHKVDTKTMTSAANKLDLLTTFYKTPSSGTTPARIALERVGRMFDVDNNTLTPASPILAQGSGGECQQNFNILMSDGYYNGNPPTWGTKAPKDTNNTDISSATDPSPFDGNASQSNDGGNYADEHSSTLADVAMHYYETDLASSISDDVPTRAGVDEAAHQHLVTYTVSFGLNGTLDPETQDPTDAGFVWPDPALGNDEKIDDMWHAAYNGRGKFLFAQSSTDLESELNLAISDISERTGTAAAVAVNSAKLSTESVVYLAEFNTNRWQGNLFAFPIINKNTGELALTPKWDASSVLTLRDMAGKPRNIITFDKSLLVPDGVPFRWASLSLEMQLDLKTNPAGGIDSDAIGLDRLNYVRGDRSKEGAPFRERLSLLGDLINSAPVFVGPPNLAWPDYAPFPVGAEAYSTFKEAAKNRRKMVYVGANDGMLHGLDDTNGEEVFGYIPGLAYSQTVNKGLHYLSDPNYIHNYYVDLSPAVSDVYISSGSSVEWHTVLIGGMRAGGRGIFALNVTNPAAFSETKAANMVLWEFTSDDDPDLGYTYSRPFIGLTNAGRWVAIFGNGYNSTGTGEASLFIVDIARGTDGNWAATDYKKISTGVGTAANPNGLATPALADLDGNGTVDRVYAGDLLGNMWVFDLSSTNPNFWDTAYKSGSAPTPLFTTPANQPITAKPVLAKHPTQPNSKTNGPNIMVYFGTGQYLVSADKTSTDQQSFYGVWDMGDSTLVETDLIAQVFDSTFPGLRVLTRNPVDYSIDHGWRFDLTDLGERAVTSPIARADTVFFNSFVPEENSCSKGGYGYKFAVDMATGGSPLEPTIDSNNDGLINEKDYMSDGASTLAAVRQEGFLPEPVFIEDLAFTAEVATKVKALADVPSGRFSWQELLQ